MWQSCTSQSGWKTVPADGLQQAQQQALAQRLPDTPVALGMSYGSPSLESAVDELLASGVEHMVVLPLYPQYSCSTVAAVWDELARILARKRGIPGVSLFVITPMTAATLMRWPRVPGIHSLNMANLIYCCSPTTAFRALRR